MVMKADVVPALSGTSRAHVPGLGNLRVVEGRGDIQRILALAGNTVGLPASRMPDLQKQWLVLGRDVVAWIGRFADERQRQPVVAFGSRDPLYNTNLLGLSAMLYHKKGLALSQLDSAIAGDSVEAYSAQLAGPSTGQPNFVVTTDRGPSEYPPYVTQSYVEEAARGFGFRPVASFRLPDGRETRIWWLDRGPSSG
jgi:hypothetical protein